MQKGWTKHENSVTGARCRGENIKTDKYRCRYIEPRCKPSAGSCMRGNATWRRGDRSRRNGTRIHRLINLCRPASYRRFDLRQPLGADPSLVLTVQKGRRSNHAGLTWTRLTDQRALIIPCWGIRLRKITRRLFNQCHFQRLSKLCSMKRHFARERKIASSEFNNSKGEFYRWWSNWDRKYDY